MRRNKKKNRALLLLLILLGVSIGFAALSTTLKINGSTTINKNTWNIYWDNIANQSGVTPTSIDIDDEDENNKDNIVTFSVTLDKPGDYFEFTVDAVNAGTIDAEVLSIDKKYNGTTIPEVEDPEHRVVPAYLKYEVKYADGTEISVGNKLPKAPDLTSTPKVLTVKTVKVRVEYDREAVTNSDINTQQGNVSHSFSFSVQFGQATPSEEDDFLYAFYTSNTYDSNGYNLNVGDVLPLEFGTSSSSASANWNGGPTDDYNNLRLSYNMYKDEYDGEYNSLEECENHGTNCVFYKNIDVKPKVFFKIYYDNDRVITDIRNMFIYNNTLYDMSDVYESDLISLFGDYDPSTNIGCSIINESFYSCLSPDLSIVIIGDVGMNATIVHAVDVDNHIEITNRYGMLWGPTFINDWSWEQYEDGIIFF